ncbi:chain-length determining protein [Bradyrhizobium sp. WBOS7]|uniref:non-specific protein-tyrosine kinase n=1 Tax=Bradyrhizobium betae TaxID=244734 RepID=A0AAE9N337_9BRAD|nr:MULTISPECIES: Wzz/FepE/Etk N-terminal domain-containing protein [Bradyrhizobium]MDD1573001.1 chain-length determining protein [Bradyrhizobium sp. WBOS1]UUO33141.1 chain-length determining protein [Bradyrhizobium sp. WBOS01]MDD1529392.1 chain-length determining protein [Bradyrhizobium sp. WBOS2]MDD1579026.1 chain-length determining protein [Bradyrhizobium sp. WBOS7]MDD1601833.1 chain-length determining protein [Bradyrhizobium sp. WBOS16]
MYQPREHFQSGHRFGIEFGGAVLSFERVTDVLRRQWPVIAACTGASLALVIVYLALAQPMYTANARIMMDTRQAQVLDKDSNASSALIDTGYVDSQVEVINSDDLILSVVRRLKLTEDPEFNGSSPGLLSIVLGKVMSPFGSREPPSQERLEHAVVETVQKSLRTERVLTTYVLSLNYRSRSPDKAAKIVNAIANAYLVGALEAKYQSTKRATEWLQQRSIELSEQATASDRAVQTFKAENNIVGTSRGLMSEQQLSDLNTQLVQARASTAEAKARLDRITAISDQDVAQSTVTDALNNSVITRLRAQYLDLQAQYADWSRRYGKQHLAAVNLANKMEELRKNIADELRRIGDAYRSDYEIAKSREASLEKNVKELVAQAGDTGQAAVKLRDLESAADTYRNLYNNFLEKLQSATQNQSFPLSEARLISTATKPERKSSPRTMLALVGGLVGGLCLGFGVAFGRELLSDVLRTPAEVEDELGVKCLGVLPDIRPPTATGALLSTSAKTSSADLSRYVVDHPFSRFAETLRNIKVSIDVARLTREIKVIGIVSSLPKEGKTTVAANFAQLIALTGHRTVLIDGDLHTRSLTRELAPNAQSGLVEALSDPASLGYHVQRSKETGLDFLPSVVASRMVNSADVIGSKAMAELLKVLREHYEYIVIDLAPVMPVADSKAVSLLIDAMVYVIEWGQTTRSALQESVSGSEVLQKKLLGAVLNRANPKMLKRIEAYKGKHHNSYYVEHT